MTRRDETGGESRDDPTPPLVFSKILDELIVEAHPDAKTGGPERNSGLADHHQELGVDLQEAASVAVWAFKHSGTWSDGWSWPQAIKSHEKFWAKYDTLEQQFRGRKQRKPKKGQRVKPLKGGTKLKPSDPAKYRKDKADAPKRK